MGYFVAWRTNAITAAPSPRVHPYLAYWTIIIKRGRHCSLIEKNSLFLLKFYTTNVRNSREFFIDRKSWQKLLAASSLTKECRVLFALCRIGGLRKNEALAVEWRDVDFIRGRLFVHSQKTERYEGRGSRIIPLFPELREELESLWESLPEGFPSYVIVFNRTTIAKMLEQVVFYTGLNRWERLIQNLRSSRAIEVYNEFGELAESEWIGHSNKTAKDHYLHLLDSDFERAIAPVNHISD